MQPLQLHFSVPCDDFSVAGRASGNVKHTLKELGFPPDVVRRVAIAMYEAEINMVIHANGGTVDATITPEEVRVIFTDHGPGIPDVSLAMQEGWSTATEEVRDLGFGAGMGLPNIKRFTDRLDIDTKVGEGTTVDISVYVK